MIDVLIVDDSPTIRQLVRRILESDPALRVVGEAGNGQAAISCCQRQDPDIITMDIHMPIMDGYATIRKIMAESPRPIVVLTSTESEIRCGVAVKGIEAGALSVIRKPCGLPGEDRRADELIRQVKAMAGVKVIRRRLPDSVEHITGGRTPLLRKPGAGAFKLVAIGASTGGPPAIKEILDHFTDRPLPVPIAIVQHISKGFVKGLARWLKDTTRLPVQVVKNGDHLVAGNVYLAMDNRHLMMGHDGRVWLMDSAPIDGHRPSVTAMFNSVARNFGASAVGVQLTGMGKDGADGLKALREAGGHTIAQDENSSVVFGMPKEAIARGAAVEVLPVNRIGARLVDLIGAR